MPNDRDNATVVAIPDGVTDRIALIFRPFGFTNILSKVTENVTSGHIAQSNQCSAKLNMSS